MKIAVHRIIKTFPETASNANLSQSRQLQGPDDNMIAIKVAKSPYVNGPELEHSVLKAGSPFSVQANCNRNYVARLMNGQTRCRPMISEDS